MYGRVVSGALVAAAASAAGTVLAADPPEVTIAPPAQAICVGVPQQFAATVAGAAPREWTWRIDGLESAAASPFRTFASAGTVRVSVQVASEDGATLTATEEIVVKEKARASFDFTPAQPVAGAEVRFAAAVEGAAASFRWDFGGGQGSTEPAPAHVFAVPGEHTVALSVGNECGWSEAFTAKVTVRSRDAQLDPRVCSALPDDMTPLAVSTGCVRALRRALQRPGGDTAPCCGAVAEGGGRRAGAAGSGCLSEDVCCARLALWEDHLRQRAWRLVDDAETRRRTLADPATDAAARELVSQGLASNEDELEEIARVIEVPDASGLYVGFQDYRRFFANFTAGYEFVNVRNASDKGFPRLGFLVQYRYFGKGTPETECRRFGGYGLMHSFAALLTNSAEQSVSLPGTAAEEPPTEGEGAAAAETEISRALEVETTLFWPWWRTAKKPDESHRSHFGPLFLIGGKLPVDATQLDARYYGGWRAAMSPEQYADFLVGRTEGLRSLRAEVRGQLPVKRFDNGSRLFLGAIGNFGLDHEKHGRPDDEGVIVPEADVVRVYLVWHIDFEDAVSGITGKKAKATAPAGS